MKHVKTQYSFLSFSRILIVAHVNMSSQEVPKLARLVGQILAQLQPFNTVIKNR